MGQDPTDVCIREIGSFFVPGTTVTIQGAPEFEIETEGGPRKPWSANGEFAADQMYVHYVRLAEPADPLPLVLMHGAFNTGAAWETKPDGNPGWQMFFLRSGRDVYVPDQVARGRSGFSPEAGQPVFLSRSGLWVASRLGSAGSYDPDPERRSLDAGSQYPLEAFEAHALRQVPGFPTRARASHLAYAALFRRLGRCDVIAMSRAGQYAIAAALAAPGSVRSLVLLEPHPLQVPDTDLAPLRAVRQLIVSGDRVPQGLDAGLDRYERAVSAQGASVERWRLPKLGLHGNGHGFIWERNSDEIASRVREWLERAR